MNTDLAIFGARDEIKELGFRLQKMMPSAQAFTADEALAVAQIANAHQLDPFNGEVWGIKGSDGKWYGVMVGIKGLRKCARRAATEENGSYWLDFVPSEPKKYHVEQQGAVVYECHLRDSVNMQAYGQAVHSLTSSGIPYKEAVEMVGPAPVVIGIGIAWPAEKSKMSLHQRAKKRAEADALKVRYDVDFGSGVKVTVEDQADMVTVEAENLPDDFDQGVDGDYPPVEHKSELQNLSELGFDTDEMPIEQAQEPTKKVSRITRTDVTLLAEIVGQNIAENVHEAKNMMNKCNWETSTLEKFLTWAAVYRGWRDSGLDSDEAAKKTNAGERP